MKQRCLDSRLPYCSCNTDEPQSPPASTLPPMTSSLSSAATPPIDKAKIQSFEPLAAIRTTEGVHLTVQRRLCSALKIRPPPSPPTTNLVWTLAGRSTNTGEVWGPWRAPSSQIQPLWHRRSAATSMDKPTSADLPVDHRRRYRATTCRDETGESPTLTVDCKLQISLFLSSLCPGKGTPPPSLVSIVGDLSPTWETTATLQACQRRGCRQWGRPLARALPFFCVDARDGRRGKNLGLRITSGLVCSTESNPTRPIP